MSFNSYQFMQRHPHERVNSHWVRGFFGEDWQESFRQRDLMKASALIGVFDHEIVRHQPLRNEYEVRNEARLRQKFVWDRELDLEMGREAVARADSRRAKYRVSQLEGIDRKKVKLAVAKYATGPEAYTCHYHPPSETPEQREKRLKKAREYYRRTRGDKRLAPVTRPKVEISPYAPLADHLEGYIKKEVKEKKLPQPEVVTATKALIEKRVEEFKSQAKTMADLEDVKEWRLKMHNALEALLKSGRVHEFIK